MHIALHFLLWPVGLAALAGMVGSPSWLHVLDERPRATLAATDPVPTTGTRAVTLTGFPVMEAAVLTTKTTRLNYSTVSKDERVLVPVVGEGWREHEPIRFVLSTEASALKQSDALVRAQVGGLRQPEHWRGSVRNVLWEGGFSTKERELFAAGGAPLAPDAVRVEVMPSDWLWSYGATGAAVFIGLFVAEGFRQRKNAEKVSKQTTGERPISG